MKSSRDDDLVHALTHRRRREIMRALHASETPLGTAEIAASLDQPLRGIDHHIQVLRRRGAVALVGADGTGKSIKAFYTSRVRDDEEVTDLLSQQESD